MKITNGVRNIIYIYIYTHQYKIIKLKSYVIIGISLIDERDQEQVDENKYLSSVNVKETNCDSHSIDSQINQISSESNISLEELMAQMKSI